MFVWGKVGKDLDGGRDVVKYCTLFQALSHSLPVDTRCSCRRAMYVFLHAGGRRAGEHAVRFQSFRAGGPHRIWR
jgi:hypothetical protein